MTRRVFSQLRCERRWEGYLYVTYVVMYIRWKGGGGGGALVSEDGPVLLRTYIH